MQSPHLPHRLCETKRLLCCLRTTPTLLWPPSLRSQHSGLRGQGQGAHWTSMARYVFSFFLSVVFKSSPPQHHTRRSPAQHLISASTPRSPAPDNHARNTTRSPLASWIRPDMSAVAAAIVAAHPCHTCQHCAAITRSILYVWLGCEQLRRTVYHRGNIAVRGTR
jgi:hypothetical protein